MVGIALSYVCVDYVFTIFLAGGTQPEIFMQFCELIKCNPVNEVLESVDAINLDKFYRWYCHDFVRSVHRVTHKQGDLEYKVR